MATLAQFSRNIRKRGSQIENSATRVVKAVSVRALKSLVQNTPVDKGVARSNWRVGIGAPTRSVIGAYAPGSKLGRGESANASAAIAAGRARIASVRGTSTGLSTAIYISNAVPYIGRLNNGFSGQAPAGFVETALLEARSELAGFRVFDR
tara:strand:+ start:13616 stop:14068 length:453 start_codon:yes stop_codon:yes gene_type:complete